MRFRDNDKSIDFSEKFEGYDFIRVQFWNSLTSSTIDLEEKHLRELRKWLTIQIRKIHKSKVKKIAKQSA